MNRKNLDIKLELLKRNILQYELASMLGMTETGLSRKLGKELSKEDKGKIMEVIKNGK